MRRGFLVAIVAAHLVAAGGGATTARVLSNELPDIENLDLLDLPRTTRLLDRNGEVLHSFAEQRRTPVALNKISPWFLKAIIATEDPRFFQHFGIDLQAIARAGVRTITTGRWGVEGGSTITQQLARDWFLHPEKTLTRKLREAYLAMLIERRYSKQEILELYVNRIYMGHGRYGIEDAAQYFFGRAAADLTLSQAALLAGLPQRPEGLSPARYPDRALARRNHVLDRMVTEGLIDAKTAAQAKKAPLGIVKELPRPLSAPYFVEEVRRWVLKQFGEEALYRDGLVVHTTLDPKLQRAAERAVQAGLEAHGRRRRDLPAARPLPEGTDAESYYDPSWHDVPRAGDILAAVVLASDRERAVLRVAQQRLAFGARELAWTGITKIDRALPARTIVPIRVVEASPGGEIRRAELAAETDANAALLALDARTGQVLALVGGKDFGASEFDRAMQAKRQAGSAFKPFIYAAALGQGFLPGQLLLDVPTVWIEPGLPQPYQPENYDRTYEGLVTLRHALEHSRNIPTIRLLDALGYGPAVEIAQRMGVSDDLKPYPSLGLGAFEVRLVDLVAAYGAFANGGVLVSPVLVTSVDGTQQETMWKSETGTREVLDPGIAAMMVSLMQGVVQRGTARSALSLGRPVAGKTGTTDSYTDAWFVGFTPSLVVGVWIGHDQPKTLGRGETGTSAALPIWIDTLREGLAGEPAEEFALPPGLEQVDVDLPTGLRPGSLPGCQNVIRETIPEGREPLRECGYRDQLREQLPYPLQRYPIRSDGALMIPAVEAARLAAQSPDSFLVGSAGHSLRYSWVRGKDEDGSPEFAGGMIPLAWGEAEWRTFLRQLPLATEDARLVERRGVDGWPAEVLPINRSGTVQPIPVPEDP
ncbi:MAG: PBP1A family penicillin-binding protein [Acidobacteria bacterium]|nr:PBP1A family penicillin-binding protein [Acidobacteriota bacterium]